MMSWMMKMMMGGWLPEGQRTQWAAFALFLGTAASVVVDWGSGGTDLMTLVTMLGDQWKAFVAAGGLYFLGEKVDAKKKEVK